ncbi:hypothetical protein Hdeb2414_s0014g00432701 [Helianthus debilis subsp. tardiflorus]
MGSFFFFFRHTTATQKSYRSVHCFRQTRQGIKATMVVFLVFATIVSLYGDSEADFAFQDRQSFV